MQRRAARGQRVLQQVRRVARAACAGTPSPSAADRQRRPRARAGALEGPLLRQAQGLWWVLWFMEMPLLLFLWFRFVPADVQKGPYAKWAFVAAAVVPVLL